MAAAESCQEKGKGRLLFFICGCKLPLLTAGEDAEKIGHLPGIADCKKTSGHWRWR